jgi:hypothetical protein
VPAGGALLLGHERQHARGRAVYVRVRGDDDIDASALKAQPLRGGAGEAIRTGKEEGA